MNKCGKEMMSGKRSNKNRFNRVLGVGGAIILMPIVFLAIGWVATIGDYSVPRTVENNPTLPVIELNGFRFHGETYGDPNNPPIVVVHGGPGWDYRSLLPLKALADKYYVIFYDQRGAGLSPRVAAWELTLESSINDLDIIVERFRNGGSVVLVGHSWGAMLVAAYLGRAPDKVSHAVLAEPGFLNSEMLERSGIRLGPRMDFGYLWFAMTKWLESLHITGPDSGAASDYFLGAAASHANPEYYCQEKLPEAAMLNWRAGATAMGAILKSTVDDVGNIQFDVTPSLKRYQHPVLLLASECNRFIGVEQQERHMKYFNEVELVTIKNSGHMLFAEQPAAAVAAVRRYLEKGGGEENL